MELDVDTFAIFAKSLPREALPLSHLHPRVELPLPCPTVAAGSTGPRRLGGQLEPGCPTSGTRHRAPLSARYVGSALVVDRGNGKERPTSSSALRVPKGCMILKSRAFCFEDWKSWMHGIALGNCAFDFCKLKIIASFRHNRVVDMHRKW